MVDRSLLGVAAYFTAATVFGAVVSIKENLPGEPLGLHVPGRVPIHLAVGLGSGLSAPWPMPVAVLAAALRARSADTWPGPTFTIVGSALVLGTLVEPATWARRSDSRLTKATVALNVLAASALIIAGRRAARTD
jgi:hypothetical protein